jgi:hypothetical protein
VPSRSDCGAAFENRTADLERWARLDRERDERFAVLDRMRAAIADVPPEEIEREVAKAVAEVRAEMAAERAESAGAR